MCDDGTEAWFDVSRLVAHEASAPLAVGVARSPLLALAGCSERLRRRPTDGGDTGSETRRGAGRAHRSGDSGSAEPGRRHASRCPATASSACGPPPTAPFDDRGPAGRVVAGSDRRVVATDRVDGGTVALVLLDGHDRRRGVGSVEAYEAEVVQDGPGDGFRDLEFSPDGETVAAVGRRRRRTPLGRGRPAEMIELDPEVDAPVAVAFSPGRVRRSPSPVLRRPVTILDAATGDELGLARRRHPRVMSPGAPTAPSSRRPSFALDDEAAHDDLGRRDLTPIAELARAGDQLAFGRAPTPWPLSVKNEPDVLVWELDAPTEQSSRSRRHGHPARRARSPRRLAHLRSQPTRRRARLGSGSGDDARPLREAGGVTCRDRRASTTRCAAARS